MTFRFPLTIPFHDGYNFLATKGAFKNRLPLVPESLIRSLLHLFLHCGSLARGK